MQKETRFSNTFSSTKIKKITGGYAMRMYGVQKRDITENPAVRKGYYGRYGHSKSHRVNYKRSERALKRLARRNGKEEIRQQLEGK